MRTDSNPSSRALPTERSAILRIFGRNTLWLWIDLGALKVGTMLAGFFLIRYFGPRNFGIYSTALGVGWLVNAAVDLGLTRYAARAVAADHREGSPVLALSILTTGIAAVIEILVLIAAVFQGHYQIACIAGGLILCNLEGTASLCSTIMTADLRSRSILPGSIISAASMIGLTAAVVIFHFSVLDMLIGVSARSAIVLTLRVFQLRSFWPGRSEWSASRFRQVVRQAWPFFTYNMTQVAYSKIAIVFFGFVAIQEKVGWFAAAFAISDVIPQWSYASSGALLPLWTRLFECNRIEELVDLRQRVLDLIVLLAIPFGVTLSVFAPDLCHLLGARFASSAIVLRVIAYRSLLTVLDGFLGHGFLIAINRVKERRSAQARSAALLATLTLIFGHFWGPVGVALALLVSDTTLILQYLRIASKSNLRLSWPSLMPSLVAGSAMAILALHLPADFRFPVKAAVALAGYVVVLIVFIPGRLVGAGRTLRESFSGS